jgi:hypothetical protein
MPLEIYLDHGRECLENATLARSVDVYLPEGSSMVETTGDGSGWAWIRKHISFVHWVFYDLRPCGRDQAVFDHEDQVTFLSDIL